MNGACLGTVSEIFDGDAPHSARGCFAQAWSVAEILRSWIYLERKIAEDLRIFDMNTERERLLANVPGHDGWQHWGPYLSERQWGTVREDYSPGGTAWEYFPHDHARSRAYRWGEDGIAGISDAEQLVCLSLALWNGADPILKERLFGLTNAEGNHGEDVKEHYFYLDATPTHSYLKMLYKYPQRAFPYADLVAENAPPRHRRAGVRAAGHRRVRRGPLLRCIRRVRAGRARRRADENHGMESRRRARRAAPDSATGVAQYLDLGAGLGQAAAARRSSDGSIGIEPAELGHEPPVLRRQRAAAVHRK